MKIYLTIFLFFSMEAFSQQKQIALQYQLEISDNKIHVDLFYSPVENDSSKFTYGLPAFGGQDDIFKGLQNIKVESPGQVKVDSLNRTLTFYYPSNTPLKISYDVADTRTVTNTRSQLFRPIIMQDYLFVHGLNLFLTLAFRVKDVNPLVSVQWRKLPEFPLFYTFDPDNNGSHVSITTADSLAYRFITGATDLTVKKFKSESGTNYLVLRSTGMPAQVVEEVEKFYVMYNSVIRQFWNDDRKIKYSLILQPYLNVNHKISGVSFGNGFIGKYNKPDSLAKGERKYVLAHEIGHYYLSDVEAFEGDNNEGQWFNEGFNDYITFFNLIRAKSMSPKEFASDFNTILKELYTSSIKNTPNNKIFENFWKLGDYAKLPYWRGCLYAFYLDNQISMTSKNINSLRNVMLDLKELMKGRKKKEFSNVEFISVVSRYLPHETVEKDFAEYILSGASIPFGTSNMLPCFKIETIEQYPVLKIVNRKKFLSHYQFK